MALTLPNTLTAGTPENITDVQENFDEIANAFPITTADITEGAVTPKKQKAITHFTGQTGAGFTPAAFASLNGDANYAYEITGHLYTTASVTPTDYLQVRANGLSTNYINGHLHRLSYNAGTPSHAVLGYAAPVGLYVSAGAGASVNRVSFTARLDTKTARGRRHWRCATVWDDTGTSSPYQDTFTTFWNETATNVTSLAIHWPGVGAVINGWVALEKLAEA